MKPRPVRSKASLRRRPGKNRPATSAFLSKASSRELHPRNLSPLQKQTLCPALYHLRQTEGSSCRFLRSQLRRIGLGRSPQARPCCERQYPITTPFAALAKPELSTLHKIGTFYFALTVKFRTCSSFRELLSHYRAVKLLISGDPTALNTCSLP
jgi:hypothetical protein